MFDRFDQFIIIICEGNYIASGKTLRLFVKKNLQSVDNPKIIRKRKQRLHLNSSSSCRVYSPLSQIGTRKTHPDVILNYAMGKHSHTYKYATYYSNSFKKIFYYELDIKILFRI